MNQSNEYAGNFGKVNMNIHKILTALLLLFLPTCSFADVDEAARVIGVPFVESPVGKVLEMGVLFGGLKTEFAITDKTYYTVWCISGKVFMSTQHQISDRGLHPFATNMVPLSYMNYQMNCAKFTTLAR